ncbi:hypothetical protein F5I97DRAFT_1877637 [Phlebopus sp. FC_14]|nr:hypothetical protein F5I97DRAFT_1877637 [Phlebopus sp. FC_14]
MGNRYLHLGFNSAQHYIQRARVRGAWAILRLRHPLLASTVTMHSYEDVRFIYTPPQSPEEALLDADKNLEYKSCSKDQLIDDYLNGDRTLSNERLSYLIVSCGDPSSLPSPPLTPRETQTKAEVTYTHDILVCAVHFLGDGMALHQFANDFFQLIGSDKSQTELESQLHEEWATHCRPSPDKTFTLPNALEDNFVVDPSRIRRAVEEVDFKSAQHKAIGGQTFPRKAKQPRHTIAHGVSVSAALFAICNLAWTRVGTGSPDLPMMMYSALNLRPYFTVKPPHDSYWFLAVGYFNVVLPNFIPLSTEVSAIFWHRARVAKQQSTRAAKNPMVVSRCRLMAEERGRRARIWAKEDDDREQGVTVAPPVPSATTRAPSLALIGLSLLGNLDGIYKHASFPAIRLHTLTTGSRQRAGGMLLFGYTFAGKLWISLGYDENGFEKEAVDRFWANVLQATDELLIG